MMLNYQMDGDQHGNNGRSRDEMKHQSAGKNQGNWKYKYYSCILGQWLSSSKFKNQDEGEKRQKCEGSRSECAKFRSPCETS